MSKKRLLIAGGSGFIGSRLIHHYFSQYAITLLTRTPDTCQNFPCQVISWDEFNTNYPDLLSHIDVVINLAGESIYGYWTAKKKERLRESRLNTTDCLVHALTTCSHHVSCFLNASAIGFYDGLLGGDPLTESSPKGSGFLSDLCYDWEACARHVPLRSIQCRIGLVLDKDYGFLPLLSCPFRAFLGGYIGTGLQAVPWIHIHDLLSAIFHCIHTPSIQGPVNFVSLEHISLKTFCSHLAHVLHRPSWCHLPSFLIQWILKEFSISVLRTPYIIPEVLKSTGFSFKFLHAPHALDDLLSSSKCLSSS